MKRITILSGLIALISLTSCNSKQEEKEVAETFPLLILSQLTLHSQRICFSNSVYKKHRNQSA
jgi:hypothetical protein